MKKLIVLIPLISPFLSFGQEVWRHSLDAGIGAKPSGYATRSIDNTEPFSAWFTQTRSENVRNANGIISMLYGFGLGVAGYEKRRLFIVERDGYFVGDELVTTATYWKTYISMLMRVNGVKFNKAEFAPIFGVDITIPLASSFEYIVERGNETIEPPYDYNYDVPAEVYLSLGFNYSRKVNDRLGWFVKPYLNVDIFDVELGYNFGLQFGTTIYK